MTVAVYSKSQRIYGTERDANYAALFA